MTDVPAIPRGTPAAGSSAVAFYLNRDATNIRPESRPRDMPLDIPRSQVYYWTADWQEGEREALAEIARGEARYFATGTDAVRWLLDLSD